MSARDSYGQTAHTINNKGPVTIHQAFEFKPESPLVVKIKDQLGRRCHQQVDQVLEFMPPTKLYVAVSRSALIQNGSSLVRNPTRWVDYMMIYFAVTEIAIALLVALLYLVFSPFKNDTVVVWLAIFLAVLGVFPLGIFLPPQLFAKRALQILETARGVNAQ